MKIAYYTDQIYLHGGIEKVLSQKLNYFVNIENHEVHLITTEQKDKLPCYQISNRVVLHDLEINYNRAQSYYSPANFIKIPTHIKRLKKKLNDIEPDVLIVCNYAFDFYFIPFISSGIKTVKEFHSSRYYYIKELPKASAFNKLLYRLNNWIEKKYSHIVVLNKDEKKYYCSNNIEVISNAITIKVKKTVKRKNNIIAAGRIAQVKQFDHLIKAWSIIAQKFPEWEVHIYGDGNEMLLKELKYLIKEMLVPNIYLMNATPNLKNKMEEASIYALTSKTECFPMVLLESLACGLPIISYNCPHGPKNIISDKEDGILIKHNDIDTFAIELERLIKNTELRKKMEINAFNNVKHFEEKNIMEQWLNLFTK